MGDPLPLLVRVGGLGAWGISESCRAVESEPRWRSF